MRAWYTHRLLTLDSLHRLLPFSQPKFISVLIITQRLHCRIRDWGRWGTDTAKFRWDWDRQFGPRNPSPVIRECLRTDYSQIASRRWRYAEVRKCKARKRIMVVVGLLLFPRVCLCAGHSVDEKKLSTQYFGKHLSAIGHSGHNHLNTHLNTLMLRRLIESFGKHSIISIWSTWLNFLEKNWAHLIE